LIHVRLLSRRPSAHAAPCARPARADIAMKFDFKRRLRTLICCGVLEIGALFGMPMRMEDLEQLLRSLAGPQVAHTNPEEDEEADSGDNDQR
jgi:hypothetical protein